MGECRRALIFGVAGQDGSYLARLLCAKGYVVYGTRRVERTNSVLQDLPVRYVTAALDSDIDIFYAIEAAQPHELYNLAGPSRVTGSFGDPAYYMRCCGVAVQTILQAVREIVPECRVFQAGSSAQFGNNRISGQDEDSPMLPDSPYGLAKLVAHQAVKQYRRWGMYAVTGLLFHHESPLRPVDFVSQKIVQAVLAMSRGTGRGVRLGNKLCRCDWSHAEDIVRGMWLSLQSDEPRDYVFASGVTRSVEEMVHRAAKLCGLPRAPWIYTDKRYWRPADSPPQLGIYTRAATVLGWEPTISFDDLLLDMLRHG